MKFRDDSLRLNDPDLLRQKGFIGGVWCDAASGDSMAILSPADATPVGCVPMFATGEIREAVRAAQEASRGWRTLTPRQRGAVMRRWAELILVNIDDLASILTAEQGKPLAEARAEVTGSAGFVDWFAEEGRRAYGEVIPPPDGTRRTIVVREPIGVVGAITPWNFPSSMVARKCAPALAAGCTIILKPAPQTPFSALALAAIAERAGVPAGVINIVTGDAARIGGELTCNPAVRKLSFTGSTAVGKLLMAQCANTVKRVSLELGGHAPFIVFADADLDMAVQGLIAAKFRNAGQTCVAANRIYLHESIYNAFASKLVCLVGALKVGHGTSPGVQIGPLISEAALRKVELQIAEAIEGGARVLCGGKRHQLGGTFFEPTVLGEVNDGMLAAREETFGPVAPLLRFREEAEVLQRANDTPYGLTGYFYTSDHGRVWRAAEGLETGIVGVNVGVTAFEAAPFGGVKESGFGREGARQGLDEYLTTKYVCVGGL
ncbi:succinate-semialdehyde dehydrogenase/glutarate-semialdehyde dehydrogenase [Rhodoligotrophos appendicifer]|uniref:NAD-dependent succinate-semialdehyde dehydrogenase n=1 Tax=Rhodoligotrophos appendicifer TaxID=987056 RepID=UPI001FEA7ADE|nr:NAD-dependent succinate-semialdehyde dehydrogenase [Rhodoligotrophos appendicifer]